MMDRPKLVYLSPRYPNPKDPHDPFWVWAMYGDVAQKQWSLYREGKAGLGGGW